MEVWGTLVRIGVAPSASKVADALRSVGLRFRTDTVRRAVAHLAAERPHPLARFGRNGLPEGKRPVYPDAIEGFTPGRTRGEPTRAPADRKGASRSILPTPNGVAPPKTIPDVCFEPEDEARVSDLLRGVSIQRLAARRAALRRRLDELGAEAWRFGVDTALERGKPVEYAVAVARSAAADRQLTLTAGAANGARASPSRNGRAVSAPGFANQRTAGDVAAGFSPPPMEDPDP